MKRLTSETCRSHKAFNQGCDARFAGLPLDANPYSTERAHAEYSFWRYGWYDIEEHWAKWVRERWPVRELVGVRG